MWITPFWVGNTILVTASARRQRIGSGEAPVRMPANGRPTRLDSHGLRQESVDNAWAPIIAEKVVGSNDHKQSGRIQSK